MSMNNAAVLGMPMKLGLKLMPIVRMYVFDTKRKFFNHIVKEIDCVSLRMFMINLECAYSDCIIDGGILESLDSSAMPVLEE